VHAARDRWRGGQCGRDRWRGSQQGACGTRAGSANDAWGVGEDIPLATTLSQQRFTKQPSPSSSRSASRSSHAGAGHSSEDPPTCQLTLSTQLTCSPPPINQPSTHCQLTFNSFCRLILSTQLAFSPPPMNPLPTHLQFILSTQLAFIPQPQQP